MIFGAVRGQLVPAGRSDDVEDVVQEVFLKLCRIDFKLLRSYDPDRANAMLDSLGLEERDGEGFRMRSDGRGRLRIRIPAPSDRLVVPKFQMLEQQLEELGIAVDVPILGRTLWWEEMRANLLDELSKPYVLTARAKGLSEIRLLLRYPLRVALNPFVSTAGYLLPYLVSGSIIVSMVMSLPTVVPVLLSALMDQDLYLAGTLVLLLGALTVAGTLISDLLLLWIDPRIRFRGTS